MNIKDFEKKLDIYGTDFSRWEGVSPKEAKSFMENSAEAQALFRQTEKLEEMLGHYNVPDPSPALLDRTMQSLDNRNAAGPSLLDKISELLFPRPGFVHGSVLTAVALVFLTVWLYPNFINQPQDGTSTPAIETFLAELEDEEEQTEILMSFFEMAENDTSTADEEIEGFLDELYGDETEEPAPGIWEQFLGEDTQTL